MEECCIIPDWKKSRKHYGRRKRGDMKIKMIVTDLDDTLLHSDKSISDETVRVFRECRKQGIITVIATARYWIGAEMCIDVLHPDYEITTDGTLVHQNGELVCEDGFDLETTNRIIEKILCADSNAEIITAVGRKAYWNSFHIAESDKLYKAEYFDYSEPLKEAAQKFTIFSDDRSSVEKLAEECGCKLTSYRGENLYGLTPHGTGKLQMIRKLADKLGIAMEHIAAFGDDVNDIPMLEACGLGVAVANAGEEVKTIADKVTLSNDEDGVARFIEKEILNHN